ncbi:hypothetical protein KFL_015740010 [Klebsormidium nitens]|uniref:Uncharacterized protein n=1 Tax=Klebsormidium nitens TaxID=105231 RepID=A0A1Y1IV39_KLENI|nr:hypothetical protein KFL_015740010 [Klebsormidium nitens]|eukprot:GAQ93489.1 hypothetical protein KFL_015740010 [Klebsormidium nitens]
MYSASISETATVGCSLLPAHRPPYIGKTYPIAGHFVSTSPAEQRTRAQRISSERGIALSEKEGVVRMEAVQHKGLWEIATVKKARAFLAVKGPVKTERWFGKAAPKPQVKVEKKQVEVKPVNFIEVDLESDDESDDGVKDSQLVDVSVGETKTPTVTKMEKHGATKAVGAATEAVGATAAEGVGARIE